MHSSSILLIIIGTLAGFFMRPVNEFVVSKVSLLIKYTSSNAVGIFIIFISILSSFAVTISIIYLSLKLSGFIPLAGNTLTFVISFFVGGVLWVVYARKFNRVCRID